MGSDARERDDDDLDADYDDRPRRRGAGRSEVQSKKLACGLCALLVGSFGVHKFIMGQTGAGIIMLLTTVLSCFMCAAIMHVIGLVEGIIYLTKSDEEFHQIYEVEGRAWF